MSGKVIPFLRASKDEEGTQLWVTGEIGIDIRFVDLQRAFSYYAKEQGHEIILNVFSHGGYLDDATAFYDWAQAEGLKFKVRVWGTAMSAATVIAAAAGKENIEIAPNASWMVHECQGGTDEMRAIGNDALVRVYRKLTGKKEDKLRAMMSATTTLDAATAVSEGFAGKVMKVAARLAAYHAAETANPVEITEQSQDMSKTIKAEVKVKLGTMEAARAAFGDGTTVEVEVPVDETTAKAIEEKDARIAQLEAELKDAQAKAGDEAAQAEAITNANKEADKAKADLASATAEHGKAIDKLKAEHEAAIKALKEPKEKKVVANNQEASTEDKENPNVATLKAALRGAGKLQAKK